MTSAESHGAHGFSIIYGSEGACPHSTVMYSEDARAECEQLCSLESLSTLSVPPRERGWVIYFFATIKTIVWSSALFLSVLARVGKRLSVLWRWESLG